MSSNPSIKACCIGSFLLLLTSPLFPQNPPAENHDQKMKDIHELLVLSNTQQTQLKVMDLMIDRFKSDMPKVPNSFWEKFASKMKEQLPLMNEKVAGLYDKHFSQADIEGILQFYKTQAGKDFVVELPGMMQEMIPIGMEWGKLIALQAMEELKKAGYPYKPTSL